jgi:hypothetical protein
MTVAELAWRRLSHTERVAIGNLLRQHPHYSLFLTNGLKAGVDESEWAFLKAATWPDFVRSTNHGPEVHSYHRPTWHYTNAFLVIPPATPPAASQDVHILQALANAVETIKDHTRPAPERAVSLCWLLHLVGDLHQPLHTLALVTTNYPKGDRGGNELAIRSGDEPQKLHAYWDELLGGAKSYKGIAKISDSLSPPQTDVKNWPQYKTNKTFASWADESADDAVTVAYADGSLSFADWNAFNAHSILPSAVPQLGVPYEIQALDTAKRRVALAGRRLGDILKKLF